MHRAGTTDVLDIADIAIVADIATDIADIADIVADIANIADIADRMLRILWRCIQGVMEVSHDNKQERALNYVALVVVKQEKN